MSGLMSGVTVLDLTWGFAGPAAGMLLADNGARLIRIEPPGGDPFRAFMAYHVWNRGKESMTLDLQRPEGREVLFTLVAKADVMMTSFQPAELKRLGIGYEELHRRFPGLVYTMITGYGEAGARRDRPGYDALVSARLGLQSEQPGYRPGPHFQALPSISYGTALLVVIGTTAALCVKAQTGKGQKVAISMEDGALATQAYSWQWSESDSFTPLASAAPMPRPSDAVRTSRARLLMGIFRCEDGQYMMVHTGSRGAFMRAMDVFGIAHRISPPDSPSEALQGAQMLSDEELQIVNNEIPALFATRPRAEWITLFQQADVVAMPVEPPGVALNDPQAAHNGAVMTIEDPELGWIKTVGILGIVPDAPGDVRGPAPLVGQHSLALLREFGLSDDRIAELQATNVV